MATAKKIESPVQPSKPTGEQSATPEAKSGKTKPIHSAAIWKVAVSDLGQFTRAAGTARVVVVPERLVECLAILSDCFADSRVNAKAYSDHQCPIGGGQNVSCRAALFIRLGIPALKSDSAASKHMAGNPKA